MAKKVLVVEDELSVADFLSDIINLIGCETKKLHSGAKVLSVAKEWKPDLITLDIMMPPPDGLEVLAQLKSDPATEHIPVFVVSVVAHSPDINGPLSKAQGLFAKPLDTKLFISRLRETCGLAQKPA
jgi:CheY-like chemotaxis protein